MAATGDETMVEMDPVGHPPKSPPPATLDLDDNVHLMNGSALASHAAPHGGSKTTSRIYDIYMIVLIVGLLVAGIVTILVANNWRANDPYEIAKIYHEKHPFIDGKNQLAYAIKNTFKGSTSLDLSKNISQLQTDLVKIKAGKLGGVVWSAAAPCGLLAGNEGPAAVQRTLYQMDIINHIVEKYHTTFEFASTPDLASEIFAEDKLLPSMISLEGGHQIHDDLAVLRMFKKLGAISMSLTAECSTAWAQTENPYNTQYESVEGLTDFGLEVIDEMNKIGMIVDLSHTATSVMEIGLQKSDAPVIFSLSGARSLVNNTLNVPSSLYKDISENGGLVMIPLWPPAVCSYASDLYNQFRSGSISSATLLSEYQAGASNCTIENVFAHIEEIKNNIGATHVGISTNFDANLGLTVTGLEDASRLVHLTARMVQARYSEADITNIIGGNLLRVWASAEEKADD